ncbi:MAG: family 1 glycosylhydrolase [Dermatophilaceae bacterium]
MESRFPEGFLWGAASAAHQVEGNNVTSDAWVLEHMSGSMYAEPSRDAVDFYHRYRDDAAMVAGLGLNCLRFGVEWGRVEPERGMISRAELDHYSRVVDACLDHGLTPVVTLHHFTSPRWVVADGGWLNPDTASRFADHCARVAERFGERVEWYCTINEVNTPVQLTGNGLISDRGLALLEAAKHRGADAFGVPVERFCPFFPYADDEPSLAVVSDAHRQAVDALHSVRSTIKAGVTLSMQEQVGEAGGEQTAADADEQLNRRFLREFGTVGDFVGVQNYSRIRYDSNGRIDETEGLSGMGLPMVPASLAATCRQAYEVTGLPVLVTEHGTDLDTDQDHLRESFIVDSLKILAETIGEGVDVRGYIHWSLHDNFEWFKGYQGHFGLVEVDRATQIRTPRPSAATLGRIALTNGAGI